MENGNAEPFSTTQSLVSQKINGRGYKVVVCLGSSKGGSAAIIHGIKLKADYILVASNQFNVGSYIAKFPPIFQGMTGQTVNESEVDRINSEFRSLVSDIKFLHKKPKLKLLYSTKEPTYKSDTKDMINWLKENNVDFEENVREFKLYGETGAYFKPWAKDTLDIIRENIQKCNKIIYINYRYEGTENLRNRSRLCRLAIGKTFRHEV